ncbi:hypothetical protein M0804_012480 [Polistes exclamans]|nr:hypothetical protein M0804_012480 [Polistes exclamans]
MGVVLGLSCPAIGRIKPVDIKFIETTRTNRSCVKMGNSGVINPKENHSDSNKVNPKVEEEKTSSEVENNQENKSENGEYNFFCI